MKSSDTSKNANLPVVFVVNVVNVVSFAGKYKDYESTKVIKNYEKSK